MQQAMRQVVALAGLAASALALASAPLVLDDSYDWVRHTTSEAGGQGVDGAWLARTGFVLFGLTVLFVARRARLRWRLPATACHTFFGVAMVSVAVYSLRSWEPGARYDGIEDLLHSVGATAMGFAFAFGVTAAAITAQRHGQPARILDGVAIVASVALPLGMAAEPSIAGVLQRAMFAIAYLWFAREALIPSLPSGDDGSRSAA